MDCDSDTSRNAYVHAGSKNRAGNFDRPLGNSQTYLLLEYRLAEASANSLRFRFGEIPRPPNWNV